MLRTLVLCDLADSTALVERLGDLHAAELFRKHDRLARTLVHQHDGREIDKTDGFLMMFDRPIEAVAFALAYQRALHQLDGGKAELRARVGIHVGDVIAWDNAPEDIAKGAKPFEVEGLVKPVTSRLMQLALPGQILLSGIAYQLAHRSQDELGDLAATALWRTHGRYRFKGLPDPIAVFEVGEQDIAPLKAPPWSGKAHREVPFWRRPATMVIEGLLVLALVALPLWYLLRPEPAIAFAKRDWVVVGDLKNLTDETSFDDSVETAFRIGLEQSRYVNVLSDLKTRETVKLMQRDPEQTKVDRAIGSEVALRDGARALILPTVAEIGGRVRVTAEVIDPTTQTTVWSESADGTGAESVLPSLDRINQRLRIRLGEALATVSSESQPLEKVATKNLDALRAYSLGIERYGSGRLGEALPLFDQALKLDPSFALAYIGKASVLISSDRETDALATIRAAAALRDHLPPRDAMYVDAWQATFGPPAPALRKWQTLTTLYPDFFKADGAYAFFAWQRANRYEDAIEAAQRAASTHNPNRMTSDYLLGVLYLGDERYTDAAASFARAASNGAAARGEFYSMSKAVQHDFGAAEKILAMSQPTGEKGADIYARITATAMLADRGRWSDALASGERAQREAEAIAPRKQRQFQMMRLALESLSGHSEGHRGRIREFLESEKAALASEDDLARAETEYRVLVAAYLAAHAGDVETAKAALDIPVARAGYPVLEQMEAVARAEYARAQGRAKESIALLKALVDGNELCVVHVALLDAYASAGDEKAALAQAEWLASHRGRAYVEYAVERMLMPFNVAQSDLALLRAAELAHALGDRGKSQRSLDAFLNAWPGAKDLNFVSARLKTLESANRPPPGGS
jgi:putative peptide modification system cyclase